MQHKIQNLLVTALFLFAVVACGPGTKTTEVKTEDSVKEEMTPMQKEFFGMTPE
jgi:hypothetical protein